RSDHLETITVRDEVLFGCAIVIAENLFVNVAEKMERFHRNVSAFQPALQETPKVLKAIRVNLSVHINVSVIDYFVSIFRSESKVSTPFIGVEIGAFFYVLLNDGLNRFPFTILYYFGSDFPATF